MKHIRLLGFVIWLLAALFYLYEFFLRVFVGTIAKEVMIDFHLTPQQFAIMGAGYYLTYAFMQVPVGILVDRFGSRLLLTLATFLAALGGFWFAVSYGFWGGFLSRCFMGFGSSFAYVCLLLLALNWFPRKYFGFVVGVANFLGALGPMLAGGPLAFLLKLFDGNWRLVLGGTGVIGFILTCCIGFFVRNAPSRKKGDIILLDPSTETLFQRLILLFKNSQVWGIMLFSGFIYVCLPLLGAYWGTAYLQAKGMDITSAASLASLLWLGMAFGSVCLGKFSDLIKRRKLPLLLSSGLGVVVSACVVYWPSASVLWYGIFFFGIGFTSAGMVVSFAAISEHVQKRLHATAIGVNNSMIMLFAALLPQLVTFLIQQTSDSQANYAAHDFQHGLFLMPIFYFMAFLIALFFIRETFCRQQFEVVKVETS